MSKFALVDQYGRPLKSEPPRETRRPRSSYDAAGTADENREHWRGADGLSPNSENSQGVRAKLRNRSRYECGNNGYFKGLVRQQANDCIGTGPRLQLALPETWLDPDFKTTMTTAPDAGQVVEQRWQEWCDAVGFTDDLRMMDKSETASGEVFAVFTNDAPRSAAELLRNAPDTPTLDIRVIEADQVTDPAFSGKSDPYMIDGVRFGKNGTPVAYTILDQHPGDAFFGYSFADFKEYPADQVIHFFEADRPSQARGVPTLTPGLPLGNQMRRLTLAALGSAELAALISGVIETDAPNDGGDAPEVEAMDQVPFARQSLLTLAAGQKAKAFEPAQPGPGYKQTKDEINTEVGRSINAPRNISTGSSAEYNFSSGRLDLNQWQTSIKIRRDRFRRVVIDRVFRAWHAEGSMIPGYLPADLPPLALWRWKWQWDGFPAIDPVKDATANEIALRTGQKTYDDVCAEAGKDWEEVFAQRAKERALAVKLGLPDPFAQPAAVPVVDQPTPAEAADAA